MKTSKDLRNEYKQIKDKEIYLNRYIVQRLNELSKQHPDCILSNSIKIGTIDKKYYDRLEFVEKIKLLEEVEQWIHSKEKIVQLSLF